MDELEGIHSLLELDVVRREFRLVICCAQLFFDILLSTSGEWRKVGPNAMLETAEG